MEGQIKRLPAAGVFVAEIIGESGAYTASTRQPPTPGVLAEIRLPCI